MADVKTEPADIEEIATIIEEHDVKKGESKISKIGHLEQNWTKRYNYWFELLWKYFKLKELILFKDLLEYVEEIETPGAAEAAAASNRLNLGSIPNENNPSSFKLFNLLGGNLPGVFPKPTNPLPKKAEKRLYGGAYLCTLCTFENTFRKGIFYNYCEFIKNFNFRLWFD